MNHADSGVQGRNGGVENREGMKYRSLMDFCYGSPGAKAGGGPRKKGLGFSFFLTKY